VDGGAVGVVPVRAGLAGGVEQGADVVGLIARPGGGDGVAEG